MRTFVFLVHSWVLLLLLFTLPGCSARLPEDKDKAATTTDTTPPEENFLVKKEELILMPANGQNRKSTTIISGRVIPKNETRLFAEVQGTLLPTHIPFKPGARFDKGDVLVKIDQSEFQFNLESQRSAFFNVLTGILPDLKSDYPNSYNDWLNYTRNYDFGARLKPLPDSRSEEEQYYLSSNQVYTLYFQIKALEERLSKYTIYAPYAGTVIASSIDRGSFVSPGNPLGKIINRLEYELEAGIPLTMANKLKINDQIRFTSNEIPGEWIGKVLRIKNIVDPTTQNVPVYFKLKGKDIKTGLYLEGSLETDELVNVTVIPNEAFGRDGSVLILTKDVISRKMVTPITFLPDSIILTGLDTEDIVILNQFDRPVDGAKVQM